MKSATCRSMLKRACSEFLQQGEFVPVGGHAPIRANVRIVAATHRDLRQMIRQGLFREDLFYRLNVVPLRLPSLRERPEDIPDLIRHFFAQAEKQGLPRKSMAADAVEWLKTLRWPGNVRELENLVRRLAALYSEDVIGLEAVQAELAEPVAEMSDTTAQGDTAVPPAAAETLGAAVERHLRQYFEEHTGLPPDGLYDRMLPELEKPLITLALRATRGNQLRAATLLGLNRNTLRKKIRALDIGVMRGVN